MQFPETDPVAYTAWAEEGWFDHIINELTQLLLFVRENGISGLAIRAIRQNTSRSGMPGLAGRRIALLCEEISATNDQWDKPVDQAYFDQQYTLSGLTRPGYEEEKKYGRFMD